MATANASLGVRCDHWKITVARAEWLENVQPWRVSFSAGNSQKLLIARLGEYGAWGTTLKLLSSKNWWTRAAQWGGALSWWKNTAAAFLGRFSRNAGRNFVIHLHKSHPRCCTLGNAMSKYHAFAVPKHGYHLRNGGNPKFLRWRWVGVLPLSRLPFGFRIECRHPCLIHCDNWWKESTIHTLVTW